MTPNQIKILVELVKLHKTQEIGGPYFDPLTGGVFSGDLAPFVGLGWITIEQEAKQLEIDGYLKLLNRQEGNAEKGLQATSLALTWYDGYLAQIAAQQAIANAAEQATLQAIETEKLQLRTLLQTAHSNWSSLTNAEKIEAIKNVARFISLT